AVEINRHAETVMIISHEVLHFWEITRPVVVVGRSGKIAEEVHIEACKADGVEVVRRNSGGGAVVLAPGCLNYSLVVSLDRTGGGRVESPPRTPPTLGWLAGGSACPTSPRGLSSIFVARLSGHFCRPEWRDVRRSLREILGSIASALEAEFFEPS